MDQQFTRFKASTKFIIKEKKKIIEYEIDVDPRDEIINIVEETIKRFTIADTSLKDIGFIDDDGLIKTWVIDNKIYFSDKFSSFESCKKIIRRSFLHKYVNDDVYVIYNKSQMSNINELLKNLVNPRISRQLFYGNMIVRINNIKSLNMLCKSLGIDHETKEFNDDISFNIPKNI